VAVNNEKLRTELQSGTTLEAKKIDVLETWTTTPKVHNIAYNNMEKADNELEHEKEEDKEYDDEDLGEEELQTLFNATYAESKVKSSYFSIKYMFDYIYHGSHISRFDMSLYELVN
jgi:hypothetical protein